MQRARHNVFGSCRRTIWLVAEKAIKTKTLIKIGKIAVVMSGIAFVLLAGQAVHFSLTYGTSFDAWIIVCVAHSAWIAVKVLRQN